MNRLDELKEEHACLIKKIIGYVFEKQFERIKLLANELSVTNVIESNRFRENLEDVIDAYPFEDLFFKHVHELSKETHLVIMFAGLVKEKFSEDEWKEIVKEVDKAVEEEQND